MIKRQNSMRQEHSFFDTNDSFSLLKRVFLFVFVDRKTEEGHFLRIPLILRKLFLSEML